MRILLAIFYTLIIYTGVIIGNIGYSLYIKNTLGNTNPSAFLFYTVFGQSITLTDLPHMRTTYMPGVILLITLSVP